jgi:PPK2 family polyphosphate:nucleotide phosphotransferase
MKKTSKICRVEPDAEVDLAKYPTLVEPLYASKKAYKDLLEEQVGRLSQLQERLYASHSHALLLIFQAMDTAGKDGCIKHVMSGINPQGCKVTSFSHPAPVELRHDFLWRTTRELPERGMIGIFNRSYYEEVLILRVHPELLQAEAVPNGTPIKDVWVERYRSINGLERHLVQNGTRVLKFFLHISKDEQRKRLLDRIETPDKNWKIQRADIEERKFWKQYQKAYEACLSATSTKAAPWYVIPADDKPNARLMVSRIVLDALEELDPQFPELSADRKHDIDAMRKDLARD